jgi:myo-inositol-1(or 4)-monophosphatase
MPLETSDPELQTLRELACELARRAGALQRERYETGLRIETKSASIDLVTEVDQACEALIVAGIRAARPQDVIEAEEGQGHSREDARDAATIRWIIDPLDGTTNFAHGFPRFCVSIGIERNAQRVVGVVYDPLLDECFEAVRGAGAWLGARQLRVSDERELGRALVATGFAYDVHESEDDNLTSFAQLVKTARGIRRDGSAALDLCYVAAGRLDGYWELKLHPWDVAAGLLIVEEAGGRTSDYQGGPPPRSGREVVATNGRLHDALLDHLAPRPSSEP